MLAVRPEPGEEFSLLDEVTLLFRMLLAGGPAACQATNLLRALRQNKGAAALGLLETHSQRSGENSDIEVSRCADCFFSPSGAHGESVRCAVYVVVNIIRFGNMCWFDVYIGWLGLL